MITMRSIIVHYDYNEINQWKMTMTTLEWWLQRGQADWLHNDYYDNIIHYDYNEVKKLSHFRPTQALDNVTNNKVVMAEARQWLDFIIRQAMKLYWEIMSLFLQGKTSSMSLESPGCTSCRFWFDLRFFGHFLQECLFPFGVAYALQKDSPYTQRLLIYEKEDMYIYIFTYVLFPHLLFPTLLRACWAQQHTYNMKVQQQDSAAEGIRTNQPLDSPGARPRWSKSWRRFEWDFISMCLLQKDPSNYFLFLKGSSRGGISPLSLDNMQPVFVVGFINSQIHLQQRHLI